MPVATGLMSSSTPAANVSLTKDLDVPESARIQTFSVLTIISMIAAPLPLSGLLLTTFTCVLLRV